MTAQTPALRISQPPASTDTAEPSRQAPAPQPTPAQGHPDPAHTPTDRSRPWGCRCGSRWGGLNTCHCAADGCHRTFSGVSTFDRHRRDGRCIDPATVGMAALPSRPYECWGYPNEAETS